MILFLRRVHCTPMSAFQDYIDIQYTHTYKNRSAKQANYTGHEVCAWIVLWHTRSVSTPFPPLCVLAQKWSIFRILARKLWTMAKQMLDSVWKKLDRGRKHLDSFITKFGPWPEHLDRGRTNSDSGQQFYLDRKFWSAARKMWIMWHGPHFSVRKNRTLAEKLRKDTNKGYFTLTHLEWTPKL